MFKIIYLKIIVYLDKYNKKSPIDKIGLRG